MKVYVVHMQKGEADKYVYGGWWSVWWTGTYSMVLSKAAFFHEKYLHMYTYEMPASIREYTTKNRFVCNLLVCSFLAMWPHPFLAVCDNSKRLLNPIGMNRNCEDIAMSFLVAHATGAPPVWVQSMLYLSDYFSHFILYNIFLNCCYLGIICFSYPESLFSSLILSKKIKCYYV